MRILIVLLTTLVAAGLAFGGPAADQLRETEKGWAAAVTSRDYAKLDKVLSDRLIYAHSTGVIELIDFLERTFSIKCEDEEIVPENLDSIANLEKFLIAKCASESVM